jgi:F-box-like
VYGVGPAVFQQVTIGSLPDNVLLDIFDFYQVLINNDENEFAWNWERLVHVCQRWRNLIFESPIRLNLQLFCTERSPVRKLLDVWPAFPLVIMILFDYDDYSSSWSDCGNPEHFSEHSLHSDNLIAAFEHRDRIRQIDIINPPDYLWEQIVTAMQGPFPVLRSFSFELKIFSPLQIPDTFLNGSTLSLQELALREISFPLLPRVLSSTSNLTSLHLFNIPKSGYIPPETMATSLSALSRLKSLIIYFNILMPDSQRRNRASPPRFVLPVLTSLEFQGVSKYLDVLVAQMDAPLLDNFYITFFCQPAFDIPQVIRFFGNLASFRPSTLTLRFNQRSSATIYLPSRHSASPHWWQITCLDLDCQVKSVAQICSQIRSFRSSVKSLNIKCHGIGPYSDPTSWLQLFRSFTSVQSLEIPATLEPFVAAAFQGLPGESAAEVFPSLHSISIMEKLSNETAQQGIQSFITARQHSGRPVAVFRHKFD